ERPLFTEESGKCPFLTPTTLEEVDETPDRFVMSTSGGYCQGTDGTGRVSRALFVPIGGQWWIVQDDNDHPSYALVHRAGSRFFSYLPKCDEFPADRLRRLGVTFSADQRDCTANDARQIDTLFRSWRWGLFHQPSGEMRIVS